MTKVIIFGNGQMAEIAFSYFMNDTSDTVAAFCVDKENIKADNFCNLPVVDFNQIEKKFSPKEYKMFVPISYKNVNKNRAKKYIESKEKGYNFVNYISSKALVHPNVKMGENCFILENNNLQPFCSIGNNVILWSGNHIGHHSKICDHCYLASHVVVSGRVEIKPYSFIGVNSSIRDGIVIGESSVIGAGVSILKSTKDKSVYISPKAQLFPFTSDNLQGI